MKHAYSSVLSLYETQQAIGYIKETFESRLAQKLNLIRVTAPLFVDPATGLNDDLNGVERAVTFDIPAIPEVPQAEIVHSLAKWKRMALGRYGFLPDHGLYTDMNAIRRDEVVKAVCETLSVLEHRYPQLEVRLSDKVSFVTTQELEDMWPDLTPHERENAYLKEHRTAFIMQIGGKLKSGQKHDGRAPDYDDWTLNGDILFWNDVLGCAFELSSMGIRVDAQRMTLQCREAGCTERLELPFHKGVIDSTLPLTMGGGIGQSRLCMLLLGKAHIGEVQASLWPSEMIQRCKKEGIVLL